MSAVRCLVCLSLVAMMFVTSGCAAPAVKKQRYFWPPPPDTPRIEWLGTYNNEADMKSKSFLNSIIGEEISGSLKRPMYVAADGKGKVYVGDYLLSGFLVFDLNAKATHGLRINDPVELPAGIAVDNEGNIFAADGKKRVIHVLDRFEKPLSVIDLSKEMKSIASIAIDVTRKHLIVPDVKGHKVIIYDLVAKTVVKTMGAEGGRSGIGKGEFNYPSSAAVDAKGDIWICDSMNARIQRFSPEGNFISLFGRRGDGPGDFSQIKSAAVNSLGHVYVTDGRAHNVGVFDENGVTLTVFGGVFANQEPRDVSSPGGFMLPQGIFIDQNDTIYVVDQVNARFQVFQYVSEKYLKEHPITADAPAAKM